MKNYIRREGKPYIGNTDGAIWARRVLRQFSLMALARVPMDIKPIMRSGAEIMQRYIESLYTARIV